VVSDHKNTIKKDEKGTSHVRLEIRIGQVGKREKHKKSHEQGISECRSVNDWKGETEKDKDKTDDSELDQVIQELVVRGGIKFLIKPGITLYIGIPECFLPMSGSHTIKEITFKQVQGGPGVFDAL